MKPAFRILTMLSLVVLIGAIYGLSGSEAASSQQQVVLRVAHSMPLEHGFHKWAEKFAEELKARVGDRVEVKIFPAAQLGSETQYLEAMKLGGLDGAILGRHGEVDPRLDILNLPFLFKDEGHVNKILRSGGDLERRFNDMLLAKGYMNLGWGVIGFREVTSNQPIRSAGDLKGINIRIPNTPVLLAAFKSWGANPVVLDISEVYTALQTGVVHAEENPPEMIFTRKFFEVQKYITMTNHANIVSEFLLSKRIWDTLPPDLQQAIMEAGRVSRDYQVNYMVKANEDLVAELGKKGMTIIRDVDRSSFLPGAKEVQAQFATKFGGQWPDIIQSITEAGK